MNFTEFRKKFLGISKEASQFIPLLTIVFHYTVVIHFPSNCDNVNHIWTNIYMFVMVIFVITSQTALVYTELSDFTEDKIWHIVLNFMSFISFAGIRAKPYKCLHGQDFSSIHWVFLIVVNIIAVYSRGMAVFYRKNQVALLDHQNQQVEPMSTPRSVTFEEIPL